MIRPYALVEVGVFHQREPEAHDDPTAELVAAVLALMMRPQSWTGTRSTRVWPVVALTRT